MHDDRGTIGPVAALGFCLLALTLLAGLMAGWLVAGQPSAAVPVALIVGTTIATALVISLMRVGILMVRVVPPAWLARWERASLAAPRRSPGIERTLVLATEEARHFRQPHVGTEHLLLGVLREGGHAARALATCAVTLEALIRAVDTLAGVGSTDEVAAPPLGPAARRALDAADDRAREERARTVTTAHLLLALAANPQQTAGAVLESLGCTPITLANALTVTRRRGGVA